MNEKLSHEQIQERLRTGWTLDPMTPGLKEAARALFRPIVEKMDGQEIIYVCRVPTLLRVNSLETDEEGFQAVATTVHYLGCRVLTIAESAAMQKSLENMRSQEEWRAAREAFINALPVDATPFQFGAGWDSLNMIGTAIHMNMLPDSFYSDLAVVAEVKAVVARNAIREISDILDRACRPRDAKNEIKSKKTLDLGF